MRPVPAELAEKVDEAIAVFAELGYDETRMEVLAERIGVPRATLYYYFSSKDELFAFALERHMSRIGRVVLEASTEPGSALVRLRRIAFAYFTAIAERPADFLFFTTDLGRASRLDELAERAWTLIYAPVRAVITSGIEANELREVDVEIAVATIYGALNTSATHFLLRDRALDCDALADAVVDLLNSGLVEQKPRTQRSNRR